MQVYLEIAPLCGYYSNCGSSHCEVNSILKQDLFTHANANVRTQTTGTINKHQQTFDDIY